MHIAICYQDVDPRKGGAETYVYDLCRGLLACGHSVDLVASSWDEATRPAGLEVHALKVRAGSRIGRIWNFAIACEHFLNQRMGVYDCSIGFLNTWGQDILIPQGGVRAASLAANAKRFTPLPLAVGYIMGKKANPNWWGYQAIESRQYDPARGSHFVAVSEMVRNHMFKYHKVNPDKVHVIPNAIDANRLTVADPGSARHEFRRQLGIPEQDTVGLFVAHNFKLKGLDCLLEAFTQRLRSSTPGSPVHLVVCGGGAVNRYRERVKAAGLDKFVHIEGFLDDIRSGFHGSDFFVLPSYYDPCSLVVFEALACGLPVITTRCNGAGELIKPGVQGEVIDRPDDIPALAAALDRMSDVSRRHAMSHQCVELGRLQSFDRHLTSLLQIIEHISDQKQRSRHPVIAQHPSPGPHGIRPGTRTPVS